MDELYVLIGGAIMLLTCCLQHYLVLQNRNILFLLPLLFAVLTFWIGLLSLLFAFVLIFIGELAPGNHQKKETDAW